MSIRKLIANVWERYKEVLGDLFIITFGGWLTFVFATIVIYGAHIAVERWEIALAEMVMSIGITVLGVERLYHDMKRARG